MRIRRIMAVSERQVQGLPRSRVLYGRAGRLFVAHPTRLTRLARPLPRKVPEPLSMGLEIPCRKVYQPHLQPSDAQSNL